MAHVLYNLWDMTKSEPVPTSLVGHSGLIGDISFTGDSRIMASLGRDGLLQLWDVKSGRMLTAPLSGHFGRVGSLSFSPQGDLLVTAAGGEVVLWTVAPSIKEGSLVNIETGEVSAPEKGFDLNFYPDQAPVIAMSPDGQAIALGFISGKVAILDTATGETILNSPPWHGGQIWGIAFMSDGKTFNTVSYNGQVILWNVDRNSPTFGQPFGPSIDSPWLDDAPQISFSEDALTIAATGEGGTIVRWQVDTDSWRAIACQWANRNLTQAEWQEYFGNEPYCITCPNLPSGKGSEK